MNLKEKYFHGILSYMHISDIDAERNKQLEEILLKLECILKCGYILPYKDIVKKYGSGVINRHPFAQINGNNNISISLHKNNPEAIDYQYLRNHYRQDIEDAFEMFIFENVSIVLNESIKEHYNLIENGIYLERQINKPISLEYMDAISILPTCGIEYLFDTRDVTAKLGQMSTPYYFNFDFIKSIEELLHKYGYNVPIVSIRTGNEFNERNEYYNRVAYPYQKIAEIEKEIEKVKIK